MMVDFSELIEMGSEPENFEEYLDRYATRVGELVNAYIPKGSHPDMDKYLYTPMLEFSRNGGKLQTAGQAAFDGIAGAEQGHLKQRPNRRVVLDDKYDRFIH